MIKTWDELIKLESAKPYWAELQAKLLAESKSNKVYPAKENIFAALKLTPLKDVRVVILGQDPYHGPNQAHGLSFSVQDGVASPPSLVNIYKELKTDLGIEPASSGNLERWAKQGVLLLNAVLTVRATQAASHRGFGWENFTDAAISAVNEKQERVVFILWGAFARSKKPLITNPRHLIIESAHPSPLSAYNGFFGSKPFSQANSALKDAGHETIDWGF